MGSHRSDERPNDWGGRIVEAKPFSCQRCKHDNVFDVYYFINSTAWPEFEETLRQHDGESYTCAACGTTMRIRATLLVDMPERDLIIFSAYGGDNGGVDVRFRQFFEKLSPVLPPKVVEAARKRPYTFVHGHRGLIALLDYLRGKSANADSPSDQSREGDSQSIFTIQGYKYGDLFFYFPGHLGAQELIGLVVATALDLESAGHRKAGIEFLQGVIGIIGDGHPWLTQELGRLLLIDGRIPAARECLVKAAQRKHCWHAVTASFIDATPLHREGEEPQSAELPHATPAERLGAITTCRHTVLGYSPPSKDIGLWDFPNMSHAAIPQEYTLENLLAGYAYGAGTMDRLLLNELQDTNLLEATYVGLHRVQEVSRELLMTEDADPNLFWDRYVEARWALRLTPNAIREDAIDSAIEVAHQLLTEIGILLAQETGGIEDEPVTFFPTYYKGSDPQFFLANSATHIRTRLFHRLRECPEAKSNQLRPQLWRTPDEMIAEARSAIRHSTGIEEIIGYFKVFVPRIVKVLIAKLDCQGVSSTHHDCELLTKLRDFETSAFNGCITAAELEFLSTTRNELREAICIPLGELLILVVDRIHEIANNDQVPQYCFHHLVSDKCPDCLEEGLDLIWEIINVRSRPDLVQFVKNGQAVTPYCRYCLAAMPRRIPLLYCDPEKNYFLLLFPELKEGDEEELRNQTSKYFESLPLALRGDKPNLAFSSHYFPKLTGADECVIVSRVRSMDEFLKIVHAR